MSTIVYENSPSSSDIEDAPPSVLREEVVTEYVTKSEAVASLLALEDESVDSRVERIEREIVELARRGAFAHAERLTSALERARCPENSNLSSSSDISAASRTPTVHVAADHVELYTGDVGERFIALEARVANLERICGVTGSFEAMPLADTLANMRRTLNLLSHDVQRVRDVQTAREPSKVDYIYARLRSTDDAVRLLPSVARRLQTLHLVHEAAIQCDEQAAWRHERLDQLESSAREWRECLSALDTRMEAWEVQSNANASINK